MTEAKPAMSALRRRMIACRFRKLVAIGPSRVRDAARPDGLVAEWLRRGLQILVRGFDSLRGLHLSSWDGLSGNPAALPGLRHALTGAPYALGACVFASHRTKPRGSPHAGRIRSRRLHDR